MVQAPRAGSLCSPLVYVEPAGFGAKGAAIDRYGLQLQFGRQEADVQTALLHYLRKNNCNVELTSLISPSRRLRLFLIGNIARRHELVTTE